MTSGANPAAEGVEPIWECGSAVVYHGDALRILQALPDASVDAVVTDPPYSSGGAFRSDRALKTSDKYVLNHGGHKGYPEFYGDNRDQRSFILWCSLWLAECLRVTKPGGCLMAFTDWRQLPALSDAIQAGGWVWRGIVVWDKTEATRPSLGWFRAQCEYILTGSKGTLGKENQRGVRVCVPGCIRERVRDKMHMTGKPLPLMKRLMEVLPPGAVVLDPFAGSGTTAVAAKETGRRSVNVEMSREYCEVIRRRISQEVLQIFPGAEGGADGAGAPGLAFA